MQPPQSGFVVHAGAFAAGAPLPFPFLASLPQLRAKRTVPALTNVLKDVFMIEDLPDATYARSPGASGVPCCPASSK